MFVFIWLTSVISGTSMLLWLLLGKKAMTNLDNVLKSRDIILQTKVYTVESCFYPGVMYRCENWDIKTSECQRIDAFELWCWRSKELKLVNPEENQPWIFIGRTDAEAETPNLATWYEELMHWKRPWCWERLKVGGEGDDRGWDGWMASLNQWTWVWANSGRWWRTGRPGMWQSMG